MLECTLWVATSRKTCTFPSPHSASAASWGCDGPEAAGRSDDTTLLNGTVCFLEAAAGLRDGVRQKKNRLMFYFSYHLSNCHRAH